MSTPLEDWVDHSVQTPLSAARMNARDRLIEVSLLQLARDPSQLWAGAVTRDGNGAPTSAVVEWPDGTAGTYSGTASVTFPGAISSYTITYAGTPTVTITQPTVTRDAAGNITNRPPLVTT